MFIDKAKVEVKAGNGGNGAISFRKEKYVDRGGPDGGNGGRGGSIIFVARTSSTTLIAFRHSRVIKAESGENGSKRDRYGRKGSDVYVEVPIGTVIFEDGKFLADLAHENDEFIVAKGGRGGRGNACFKSPVIRVPKIAENGIPGEKKILTLELKLLADVGLVGLPNAGKSTLLSVISSAKPEIGDFPFTTISPNLGVVSVDRDHSFVVADLPGLIEGAAKGKGLGLTFLRHIERCRILLHLVAMDGIEDPITAYTLINHELDQYGFNLLSRPMIVVATKMDEEGTEQRLTAFQQAFPDLIVMPISAVSDDGIRPLLYKVMTLLEQTPALPLFDVSGGDLTYKVYDATEIVEAPPFYLEKTSSNVYQIKGEQVINMYRRINLSTDEGLLKLLQYLRRIGVDEALAKAGAQDGDTVILDDFEFDYYQ